MFTTLPPAAGVKDTELMVTANERIEVFGGGVNGSAASTRFNDPLLPPPPQFVVHGPCTPLQEERERKAVITAKNSHFLGFMQNTP
jgi:hypothetical protein